MSNFEYFINKNNVKNLDNKFEKKRWSIKKRQNRKSLSGFRRKAFIINPGDIVSVLF